MERFLRGYFNRFSLSVMFSIVIFIIALIVSTVIQTVKYQQAKTVLEEKLKLQAMSVLNFADVLLESRNDKDVDIDTGNKKDIRSPAERLMDEITFNG